jgi:hypothetical protein
MGSGLLLAMHLMDKAAVDAARACLERARDDLGGMRNADSFAKLEKAWSDFLVMANRVYAKLEQGAKVNGTSRGWFGRKKHERRKDPLLSYIKNARDVDEHGLQRITEQAAGRIGVNFPAGTVVKRGFVKNTGSGIEMGFTFEDPNTAVAVHVVPSSVKLVKVTNHGDLYQPPETHMGRPVPRIHPVAHPNPVAVATLAIAHLSGLIAEAESLAQ